jgi:pimeloyl-ACP methyl ester carboxylesterase
MSDVHGGGGLGTKSCPPCEKAKCPRTDAIVLTVVGAVLLVIGAMLVAAHFGLEAMADKLLFNAPVSTYGASDPRLRFVSSSPSSPSSPSSAPSSSSPPSPDDGQNAVYLEVGPSDAKNIVVFLHGTASDAGTIAGALARDLPPDTKVWIPEYPGFGIHRNANGKLGVASERGAIEHAKAVMHLAHGHDPSYTLMAHSLGTGVAMGALADEKGEAPSKLILVSPFTSFKQVVGSTAPFWATLVPERFPSAKRAPEVGRLVGPENIVIHHGEKDQLVPIAQGKEMANLLGGARFESVDAGHDSMNVSQLLRSSFAPSASIEAEKK